MIKYIKIFIFLIFIPSFSQEISLNKDNEVSVIINKSMKTFLNFDTGAASTSLPKYMILNLIQNESIKQEDFKKPKKYVLANGDIVVTNQVLIRYIKVGNKEVRDIEVSVSEEDNSLPLLGRDVMEKLGILEIDLKNNKIIIK